jgi:hypothetical protein
MQLLSKPTDSPTPPSPEPPESRQETAAERGRPHRFTPELKAQFCTYLRLGCTRSRAAGMVRIGRKTVTRALRDDPDFARQVQDAQADGASAAFRHINQAAPTHWRAAAWMLDQRPRQARGRVSVRSLIRSHEFKEAVQRVIAQSSPRNQAVELIREFLNERAKDALVAGPHVDVFDIERFPLLTLDFSNGS